MFLKACIYWYFTLYLIIFTKLTRIIDPIGCKCKVQDKSNILLKG